MTTYISSAYNKLETPSGAIGEAPDPAGDLLRLRDQIDARLGAGGELATNLAAITAIPTARCFTGKKALALDTGTVFRWNGTGWMPWESEWTAFSITGNWTASGTSADFRWKFQNGDFRYSGRAVLGSSPSIPSTGFEINLPPAPAGFQYAQRGTYGAAGTAVLYDVSAFKSYAALLEPFNASNGGLLPTTRPDSLRVQSIGSNGAGGDPNTPFAWANGDWFSLDAVIPMS